RDEVVHPTVDQQEGRECTDRDQFAVGEIDEPGQTEHERHPERDQGVHRPDDQSVDEMLSEDFHDLPPRVARRRTPRTGPRGNSPRRPRRQYYLTGLSTIWQVTSPFTTLQTSASATDAWFTNLVGPMTPSRSTVSRASANF